MKLSIIVISIIFLLGLGCGKLKDIHCISICKDPNKITCTIEK